MRDNYRSDSRSREKRPEGFERDSRSPYNQRRRFSIGSKEKDRESFKYERERDKDREPKDYKIREKFRERPEREFRDYRGDHRYRGRDRERDREERPRFEQRSPKYMRKNSRENSAENLSKNELINIIKC